ncbi:hypothetical protein [Natronococcus occultus]|uniref:Uncharacterized protein n=1 Tax=Natronococcus occultus SP4 TaxID=694430 RepID=L0K2Z2_9EURY|nr:hypothetical protein [Natronococcus occultus]AGB38724.1 hypothetical protein Natoc_2969 [Natronococcus occultus SP4]
MNEGLRLVFLLIGVGYGLVFFILAREVLRAVVDMSVLVPQVWFMGIVANVVGLLVVLALIGGTNRLVIKRLEIDKMG